VRSGASLGTHVGRGFPGVTCYIWPTEFHGEQEKAMNAVPDYASIGYAESCGVTVIGHKWFATENHAKRETSKGNKLYV
jgi:hypothetical protein